MFNRKAQLLAADLYLRFWEEDDRFAFPDYKDLMADSGIPPVVLLLNQSSWSPFVLNAVRYMIKVIATCTSSAWRADPSGISLRMDVIYEGKESREGRGLMCCQVRSVGNN